MQVILVSMESCEPQHSIDTKLSAIDIVLLEKMPVLCLVQTLRNCIFQGYFCTVFSVSGKMRVGTLLLMMHKSTTMQHVL